MITDNDKQRAQEIDKELSERDLRDALEEAYACLEHERPYTQSVQNRILNALGK
jgi:hypothetical protein